MRTSDTSDTPPSVPVSPVLAIDDLKMHFPIQRGFLRRTIGRVKAVDGVTFSIQPGETFGLVGESGCGKTTTGRLILRGYIPTHGSMIYRDGNTQVDLAKLDKKELSPYRRRIRMVFQDPYSSLDPRMTIREIIGEPLVVNEIARGTELDERVKDMLVRVGLRAEYINRYPHAFSGGERQRVGIARALVTQPDLVILDEAVSALDVSIRAQTLNLLQDLQEEFGLTYLFVAHDLSVVEHISDRVAVMYVGKLVETAPTDELYRHPLHPYTEALLSAVPKPDPRLRRKGARIRLKGEVADPANPPTGCYFHPRCPYADRDRCVNETPALREVAPRRRAACHYVEKLSLRGIEVES
jgi:peptide/nickel transport system ATP-binding protein